MVSSHSRSDFDADARLILVSVSEILIRPSNGYSIFRCNIICTQAGNTAGPAIPLVLSQTQIARCMCRGVAAGGATLCAVKPKLVLLHFICRAQDSFIKPIRARQVHQRARQEVQTYCACLLLDCLQHLYSFLKGNQKLRNYSDCRQYHNRAHRYASPVAMQVDCEKKNLLSR